MSVLIVAGEASADLHGAGVLRELKQLRPHTPVFGIGGPAMRAAGLEASAHAEDISLTGLTEVLLSLPRVWRIMRRLVALAKSKRPQVAILIDLPDFNLRLAKRLHQLGIPVLYYISPQLWAWRQKRVEHVRRYVARMLVILPFEKQFYQSHGITVDYVGHPLTDALPTQRNSAQARAALQLLNDDGPVVALLPGSRRKEISRHLPIMLQSMRALQQEQPRAVAVVPVASTISPTWVEQLVRNSGVTAHVLPEQATQVLSAADAAVVCSGTASLQTVLLACPMVVVYKVSWLSYIILKRLIKVTHIAMVNLISGKTVVPELIQRAFTPANVLQALKPLIRQSPERQRMLQTFASVRQLLTCPQQISQDIKVDQLQVGQLQVIESTVSPDTTNQGTAYRVAQVVCSYVPNTVTQSLPTPNCTKNRGNVE